MPIVCITTNVTRSALPSSFLTDLSQGAAEILSADTKHTVIIANTDVLMSFHGSSEPAAFVQVLSPGTRLTPDNSDVIASKLTDLIVAKLGLAKDRMNMVLKNVPLTEACYMGSTLATLRKV